MDPKRRPNQPIYDDILRRMTAEQKLRKAFELTEFSRALMRSGLRERNPDLSEEDLHALYLRRLVECPNRNY